MNQEMLEIWQEAKEIVKTEMSEVSFNTWIKELVPLDMDEHTLVLQAPSDFNKGILEKRYNTLIRNTINHLSKTEYSIKYVIPEDEYKALSKNVETTTDEFETTNLNPRYIFEEFVIGSSNRFAHAASLAVAESPAKAYNPLFIYGGVGLGKTHLMHAIGHFIQEQNRNAKVVYVSSETFTNELINSIKEQKNEEFRNRYRTADVLLVDDIQFIAGKERTQEEFFHTFNALHEANKQIIISSDRPPKEIPTLEDRLRSRFQWGLITDIQAPDFETRIAILRKKAERDNIDIINEVFEFIAKKVKSNIRELEGALNKVIAYSSLTNTGTDSITIPLVQEALKDIINARSTHQVTPDSIKDIVAQYYNLKSEDFISKKRTRQISYPRQIAMYLCRELTDLSLPRIGEEFGGRDHTTVMHACDKIIKDLDDAEFKMKINKIIREIKGD